jgi:hypothetical protein
MEGNGKDIEVLRTNTTEKKSIKGEKCKEYISAKFYNRLPV